MRNFKFTFGTEHYWNPNNNAGYTERYDITKIIAEYEDGEKYIFNLTEETTLKKLTDWVKSLKDSDDYTWRCGVIVKSNFEKGGESSIKIDSADGNITKIPAEIMSARLWRELKHRAHEHIWAEKVFVMCDDANTASFRLDNDLYTFIYL